MSNKPKVLRILNRFNLGGPVYNASYLTKYLEDDFETLLIGGEKLDEEESALFIPETLGITPLVIPEMTRSIGIQSEIKAYRKIKEIIKEFKPDIVHTHASKAGALGRMAASNSGVKHIVHTFHGNVFEHYFGKAKTEMVKNIERYLARKSEAIIAISQIQKNDLVSRFKIAPKNKVHVVPLGFELERFRKKNQEKRDAFRQKYGLSEHQIAIGIIGRLAPVKNHRLFIESFAELYQSNKNAVAFIIGDGDLREELEELAKKLGLNNSGSNQNIFFTSWIKDVSEILPGLDIVTLTSFNEGTPVSLIEAQASKKAVISTDVGGVRDIMSYESGIVFKSGDKTAFTMALSKLCIDEKLRIKMGSAGEKFVMENFTAQRLANDVKKLYLDLLNK